MGSPWNELGDRIFVRRYARLDQNIGVIAGDESLVVIDTRADHADADELRAELSAVSSLPVGWVINTHVHWDHTFGNARFPDSMIAGHIRCRDRMLAEGEHMRTSLMEEDWVDDAMRSRFAEVRLVPPQVTFDARLEIHLGERTVALEHLGRGHTDSDIVISVDDVTFAGDLVEEGAPPSFGDAYPAEWLHTLDHLIDRVTGPVVPGHGDVVDLGFVRDQRQRMNEAIEAAERGVSGPYPSPVMAVIAERLHAR